jgi:hypothetical protein
MRQSQSHHSHRLDQVPFKRAAPVVIGAIGDACPAAATANIVDQNVDTAVGRGGGLDQPAGVIGISDIASVRDPAAFTEADQQIIKRIRARLRGEKDKP